MGLLGVANSTAHSINSVENIPYEIITTLRLTLLAMYIIRFLDSRNRFHVDKNGGDRISRELRGT